MNQLIKILASFVIVSITSFQLLAQCTAPSPYPATDPCYQTVITNDSWCCNNTWDALCQSAYDACVPPAGSPCSSITPLTGCGTSINLSLSGTGAGWSNAGNCGFSTPGTESIVSFTATSSGIHSLDVTSISGGFIDFAWVNATAGCGPTVGWTCIDDILSTGNYGSMNWVAGETYYILVDPEGTGSYSVTFNVDCPNPGGPVVAGDCGSAQPVCTNLAFQIDPNGFGLVDELCTSCTSNPSTNPTSTNFGCLNAGELNSTWFTVNVANGGTLEFSFGTPASGNCYDWIMWPYDATACAGISGNTLPPTTCNWNSPCDGYTGVASTPPAGGNAGNFEPTMTVNTGDQFVICFSNYSSALTTVPLDFFGTADISCTVLPVEMTELAGKANEGYNELLWSTLSEFHNSHFEIERSSNGVDFTTIGKVEGVGNSQEETRYSFNHYGFGNQTNYYRIKQIDIDGGYEYSNTISICNTETNNFKVITAFPNPAKEQFNVQLYAIESSIYTINLQNTMGRTVRSFYDQNILIGNNNVGIPIEGLPSGVYYVTITDDHSLQQESVKLIVQ